MYISCHNHISFDKMEIVAFLEKRKYIIKEIEVNETIMCNDRLSTRKTTIMIAFQPFFENTFETLMQNNPSREQFEGKDISNVFQKEYKEFVLNKMMQ